ncbi:MAG: SUF system NifU family Fe-S cluster assembly protein [Gemmatimonadota bacterium]|nr:SUF system NifU family Fe-S cluster assembly protein [Gemmatimonadota bacterium]
MPPDRDGARLQAVYQELLLEHYRRPRNRGPLEHADVAVSMRNPLCGDVVTLQVAFDDDHVREAKFTGEGCAISQAAASMMTQLVKGKPMEEADRLRQRFRQMLLGDAEAAADPDLGELRALAGVARLPVRVKCALVAWNALDEAFKRRSGQTG